MVQSNIDLLAQILINNTYNNYDNDNNNYSNVNTITKLINSTVLSLLLSPPSSLSSSKTSINPNDDPQQQYRHPNTYRSLINESFINYNNDNFAQNSLKNGDLKYFNPLNMYPNDDIDNDTNMIINETILLSSKLMPSILEPSSLLSSSASEASISSTTSATTIVDKLYLHHILIALILTLIILSTVIGNLLVIAAIIIEKNLRSVGNYLVFSLAFADLMVALFVMPFGAIIVVKGKWLLGANICDLWTIADVLCCTASILHLLAIALHNEMKFYENIN